ncbi:MAG: hypothetical protein IT438_06850 [Phycisphaerales bacterium]|nr:hypothetical protein [Phycisphaerales bacterium]
MRKNTLVRLSKAGLVVGILGVAASTAITLAAPPRPGSGCPRRGIYCLDVYDPVECTNRFGQRQTFSNSCYAYVACATGCTAGGTSQATE